jgi:SAM-dependent methyltransferase
MSESAGASGHGVVDGGPAHRFTPIRQAIGAGTRGIEIGPFLNPMVAKRDGYQTLVVDRYDQESLRARAREKGATSDELEQIEPVDFVGDASRLLDLLRGHGFTERVDWIVSCHNFEHLPDPLRFLRDCEALLNPGGMLAMIVPDKRSCFDRYQPPATVAGMIEASESRSCSATEAWAAFRQSSLASAVPDRDGATALAWRLAEGDPEQMLLGDPRPAYGRLRKQLANGRDPDFCGHRWRFTPAVFESILFDLRILGLVGLEVEAVAPTAGEFSVRLRATPPTEISGEEIRVRRTALFLRAEDEAAVVSRAYRHLEAELAATRAELERVALRAA